MGTVLCAENYFDALQFPGHVVSADEEVAGFEAFRVATARRHPLNGWHTSTPNVLHRLEVACDQVRGANLLALDRGHNADGQRVKLVGSSDDFATTVDVLDVTLPSVVGGDLDGPAGARTEEGAWLIRFPAQAFQWWGLEFPAAADFAPRIVGAYLALAYETEKALDRPWEDEGTEGLGRTHETPFGWIGTTAPAARRSGTMQLRMRTRAEYDVARLHIVQRYWRERRAMWIVHDPQQAERAVLAIRPTGRLSFRFAEGWAWRQSAVPWTEHQPRFGGS